MGRKSDAIALCQRRKSEIRAGAKLPDNLRHKGETLGAVIDRAILSYTSHRPRSLRTASTHLKLIKADLGHPVAADLTPDVLDQWVSRHKDWSAATKNRYKAAFGRALQLAVVSGILPRNAASDSIGKLFAAYLRHAEEGALSGLLAEITILHAASRHNAAQVLRDATTAYKVDADAISLKVEQEFAVKKKAKLAPKPAAQAIPPKARQAA